MIKINEKKQEYTNKEQSLNHIHSIHLHNNANEKMVGKQCVKSLAI